MAVLHDPRFDLAKRFAPFLSRLAHMGIILIAIANWHHGRSRRHVGLLD
jgi:hypothetical protein